MAESNAQLWWEEITGPSQMVRGAVAELVDGDSVLLCVPGDLPWPDQMRRSMEQALREDAEDILVDYIDAQADYAQRPDSKMKVAEFLLSRYAKSNVRDGYRRSSKQSIQQYTIKNEVLKNRVIWVRGLRGDLAREWIDYCKDYRSKSAQDGVFVLECLESPGTRIESRGLARFAYDEFAHYYDELLFNNLVAAPLRSSPQWRQYLATASTELCGRDTELSAHLIAYLARDTGYKDPIAGLEHLIRSEEYEGRYDLELLEVDHPYAIIQDGVPEDMNSGLWRAQLQVLYPLLEYERVEFVERFFDLIQFALNEEYADPRPGYDEPLRITQTNDRISNPYDVEIGTLYHMNKLRIYRARSYYLLYLGNEEDRNRLALLREMRNHIAHTDVCSADQVREFLDQFSYRWKSSPYISPYLFDDSYQEEYYDGNDSYDYNYQQ